MIFYDWSSVYHYQKPMVGIPRVIHEIYHHLKDTSVEISRVVFNEASGKFYLLTDDESINFDKELDISKGDILISLGCNWDYPSYNLALKTLKNKGLKYVQLYHDIIPCIYPYFVNADTQKIYQRWFLESYEMSDLCFTISKNSKNDIYHFAVEKHRLKEKVCHVIPLGFRKPDIDQSNNEFIPTKKYVLSVGTIEYRKNHMTLLHAWRHLIDQLGEDTPLLILVGKVGWMHQGVVEMCTEDPLISRFVKIYSGLEDGEVAMLYENCAFTIYPSYYEGWGLPVVESLAYGKVCVASNTSSIREIAPSLLYMVDPRDMYGWIAICKYLITSPWVLEREERRIRDEFKFDEWKVSTEAILSSLPTTVKT